MPHVVHYIAAIMTHPVYSAVNYIQLLINIAPCGYIPLLTTLVGTPFNFKLDSHYINLSLLLLYNYHKPHV